MVNKFHNHFNNVSVERQEIISARMRSPTIEAMCSVAYITINITLVYEFRWCNRNLSLKKIVQLVDTLQK